MAVLTRQGRNPSQHVRSGHERAGSGSRSCSNGRVEDDGKRNTDPAGCAVEATDADLVASAQDDPLAFAPLYQRYVTPVYRYCFRQTSDPDVAADLTAHIFTKALEGLPRYQSRFSPRTDREGGGTFRSWLFAIAHTVIIDRRRREKPTQPFDPTHEQTPDPDDGPEFRAIHQDELARLMAVLDRLPESHRQIIELRLAGLTSAEIATSLGLSRAAVKSAQTRAYSRLRDLLEPPDVTSASELKHRSLPASSSAEEKSR